MELAKHKDHGAQEEARKALVRLAFEKPGVLDQVLVEVKTGVAPLNLLLEILSQPVDQLKRIADQILALLPSSSPPVRERIIRSLDSGWLTSEAARELARRALSDDAASVRSAAVEVLRRQSQAG
jgi:HEAT repeat protein